MANALDNAQEDAVFCALHDEPVRTKEPYSSKRWFKWFLSGSEEEFTNRFRAIIKRDPDIFALAPEEGRKVDELIKQKKKLC